MSEYINNPVYKLMMDKLHLVLINDQFLITKVSQGNVATRLGVMRSLITILLHTNAKSDGERILKISQHGQESSVLLFWLTAYKYYKYTKQQNIPQNNQSHENKTNSDLVHSNSIHALNFNLVL